MLFSRAIGSTSLRHHRATRRLSGGPRKVLSQPEVSDETSMVLISRTNALVRYALRHGTTSIGRSDENDIVVADALVSRHHATITLDEAGCTLTDLETGNGTFVNSERVKGTATLNPGDVVDIGRAEEFRLIKL